MATLWIVHREPEARGVLARLLGDPGALAGSPSDPRFEGAEAPEIVLLGLSADFEQELEFAHRFADRCPGSTWMLLPPRGESAETRRLFDTLAGPIVPYPPAGPALRRTLEAARRRHRVAPLSQRRRRDQLSLRFARWFADLEIPELFRALDPHLADIPLVVRGELGCGRSLLARYVHSFATRAAGLFVALPCAAGTRCPELLEGVRRAEAAAVDGPEGPLTVCLEEIHRLAGAEQRRLGHWVELGLPPGVTCRRRVRWVATVGDPRDPECAELEPRLETALAGITLRIPPLRERSDAIGPFVDATVAAWCRARGERPRTLAAEAWALLREYPWPGNLAELEAVVVRSLASDGADPLPPTRLRFDAGGAVEPARDEIAPTRMGAPEETATAVETAATGAAPAASPERFAAELAADMMGPLGEAEVLAEEEAAGDEEALEPLETEEEIDELWPLDAEPEPPAAPAVDGDALSAAAMEPQEEALRPLMGALAAELRQPVESLRRMAEILPAHANDPAYQMRFHEQVEIDAARLGSVVERLDRLGGLGASEPHRTDLAELLDDLLETRRGVIQRRRLLVLRELDRDAPHAWVDPEQLRFAVEALLDRALSDIPERGDLYLSSKRHPGGLEGRPSMRVLLRFESPRDPAAPHISGSLELALASAVVRTQGGTLAVDRGPSDETIVLFDLPAPA